MLLKCCGVTRALLGAALLVFAWATASPQTVLALGDDEIIMNSWQGQSIEEVLQVWGLPGFPFQGGVYPLGSKQHHNLLLRP